MVSASDISSDPAKTEAVKNWWMWGAVQLRTFQDLKATLTAPPNLAMYDPNREGKVSADASSVGLGGVLLQRWPEKWRLIAYIAQSLSRQPSKDTHKWKKSH